MAEQPLAIQHPSKILAVHVSYRSRAMERGSLPLWPSYFLKPPNTLAADGDPVRRPPGCELLAFEGEIALVIGARTTRVAPARAWSRVQWVVRRPGIQRPVQGHRRLHAARPPAARRPRH
jgi:5-oxopent-3-ene-1,2,5-tricarboxylate decarboxylase / 2-hydroxyhepta-2,4-diene-1,7-dioate isomerase